ncbi:MAG: 30S ribosomal protein S9 [bacterium]
MEKKTKTITTKKEAKKIVKPAVKEEKSLEEETKKPVKVSVSQDQDIKVRNVNYIRAVGRRKTAVARVRLFKSGKGNITVNNKDWKNYFPTASLQYTVFSPIKLASLGNDIDFTIKVVGGGSSGQADAVRHGIAKALLKFNEELKPSLRKSGFLSRDSRKKERKKPGLKRARRAPQWKKR